MRHVDTSADAIGLAHDVLDLRDRPLVLISTFPDGSFAFDPHRVADELRADADVVTIATGDATFALEGLLPAKTHVFNGAARSYPPDFGADPDWRRSLLRFPGRSVEELIDDALAHVVAIPAVTPVRREWVRATVERISGATGNVARLPNGDPVMVVADGLPSTVKLADALVVDAPVEGWLTGRDLIPEPAAVDMTRFVHRGVTLARVVKVTDLRASLLLHPDAPEIVLRRRDVVPGVDQGENPEVKVGDIVRIGQTLRARIVRPGADVGLSLVGVGAELPFVAPLPLLRGGPPWLQEGVDAPIETTADAEHTHDSAESAVEAVGGEAPVAESIGQVRGAASSPAVPVRELAELRDEVAAIRDAVVRLGREVRSGTDLETLDRLRDESAGLSAELSRERDSRRQRDEIIAGLRQELREARAARPEPQTASVRSERSAWPDGEAWLRHEVTVMWARRTGAFEKQQHPLKEYIVGPRFLGSVEALGDSYVEKVLRCVIDVLTGRAPDIPSRDLHRLRSGYGAGDPVVTRADGATCWRASLESNTASARRLHYWQLDGDRIELSRVVLHDDVTP